MSLTGNFSQIKEGSPLYQSQVEVIETQGDSTWKAFRAPHPLKIHTLPTSLWPETLPFQKHPGFLYKNVPKRSKPGHCTFIKRSMTSESAKKQIEDDIFVFSMGVKANKLQIGQDDKKNSMILVWSTKSVQVWWREKTVFQLTPDYDALDVDNKVGIIYTESSCLFLNIQVSQKKKKPTKQKSIEIKVVKCGHQDLKTVHIIFIINLWWILFS